MDDRWGRVLAALERRARSKRMVTWVFVVWTVWCLVAFIGAFMNGAKAQGDAWMAPYAMAGVGMTWLVSLGVYAVIWTMTRPTDNS